MKNNNSNTGAKIAKGVSIVLLAGSLTVLGIAGLDCTFTKTIHRPCLIAQLKGVFQGRRAELEHIASDLKAEGNEVDFGYKGQQIYVLPSGYRMENRNGEVVGVKVFQVSSYRDPETGKIVIKAPEGTTLVQHENQVPYAEHVVKALPFTLDRDVVYYKQYLYDRPVVCYNTDGSPMAVPVTYIAKEQNDHTIKGDYALDWYFGYYFDNQGRLVNTRDGVTTDSPILLNNTQDSKEKQLLLR